MLTLLSARSTTTSVGTLMDFVAFYPAYHYFDLASSPYIDEYWLRWKDLFLTAVDMSVPKKKIKDTNSPPWIDGAVCSLISKK